MAYISTKERAQMIRTELKKIGLSSADVSVTSESYSMGSSINVRVKSHDGLQKYKKVKAIAQGHESVDRCEMSGDVLGGANRYVSVTVDSGIIQSLVPSVEITENSMTFLGVKCLPISNAGKYEPQWYVMDLDNTVDSYSRRVHDASDFITKFFTNEFFHHKLAPKPTAPAPIDFGTV